METRLRTMPKTPPTPQPGDPRGLPKDSAGGSPAARPGRLSPLVWAGAATSSLALASLVAAPQHWPPAVAALLGCHLVVGAAGLAPRSRLLGPNMTRLPASAGSKVVALTFDDGPDPEVTPAVLKLLDEAGAQASFFLIGRRAEAHGDLVREIAHRGHRVENHTLRHPHAFAFYGPRAMAREIDQAQALLTALAGRPPRYFRPPAGFRGPLLEPLLGPRGLHLATWTRRGFDTVEKDPKKIAGRLVKDLAAGDILLLHDGNSARSSVPSGVPGRPVVLEALPRVLESLARAGLTSVALPEG